MTKRVAWFTGKASSGAVTPHKVYDVFNEDGDSFNLKDDTGDTRFCLKQGCAHICYKDWVFADVVEVGMKADTIVKPKKSKKWSEWRKHTTGNVPKELEGDDIVKVKLRNLPKGNPFTVGTGCWVECGDYTIMEYKVKLNGKEKAKKWSDWLPNITGNKPVGLSYGQKVKVKWDDGDVFEDFAGITAWYISKDAPNITHYKVKLKDVSEDAPKDQEKPKSKWTKNTGAMPVKGDVAVMMKFSDNTIDRTQAQEYSWDFGQSRKIVKWRLAD